MKLKTAGSDPQEILVNVEHVTSVVRTESGLELTLVDGSTVEVDLKDLESFKALVGRDEIHYLSKALRDIYELLRARLH